MEDPNQSELSCYFRLLSPSQALQCRAPKPWTAEPTNHFPRGNYSLPDQDNTDQALSPITGSSAIFSYSLLVLHALHSFSTNHCLNVWPPSLAHPLYFQLLCVCIPGFGPQLD